MTSNIAWLRTCIVPKNAMRCSQRRLILYSFIIKHKTLFIDKMNSYGHKHNITQQDNIHQEKRTQNINKTEIKM
jgi:hypothetical protein